MGALTMRTLLFRIYIRAREFWKFPNGQLCVGWIGFPFACPAPEKVRILLTVSVRKEVAEPGVHEVAAEVVLRLFFKMGYVSVTGTLLHGSRAIK